MACKYGDMGFSTLLPKQPCVVQQLSVLHALSLARHTQRLEHNVQSKLVPELEAIHYTTRDVVDLHWHSADAMRLEPFIEGLWIEAIYGDGHRQPV